MARFQLQEYPTVEAYEADGRTALPEMAGSINIRCSAVQPGRITLGQAIGEAITLLVKPRDRLESAFGAGVSSHRPCNPGRYEFQTGTLALVRSVFGPDVECI